jgi:hypothetical protein|tara:strand:- start:234 stop:560 length:327 start_codon:yes stop_codon:yes gene_type:complete
MKIVSKLYIQGDLNYNIESIKEDSGKWCKFLLTYSFEDSETEKNIYILANGIGLNKIIPSSNDCVDRNSFIDLTIIEKYKDCELNKTIKDYIKKLSFVVRSNKFGFNL